MTLSRRSKAAAHVSRGIGRNGLISAIRGILAEWQLGGKSGLALLQRKLPWLLDDVIGLFAAARLKILKADFQIMEVRKNLIPAFASLQHYVSHTY